MDINQKRILVNELTTIQMGSELDHNKDSSDRLVLYRVRNHKKVLGKTHVN